MIFNIYKKVLNVLIKKPFKLWGIALLSALLSGVSASLFPIPGLSLALQWLLQTAMCMIFLYGYTGKEISVDQLFSCFKDWNTIKRVLGGIGWESLWILLWSLIPVVGPIFGVIRTYEYRLTPYILMNEPEIGIKDAIKVSKERTKGYKGKMFLSDILWIVAVVIASLVLLLLSGLSFIGWIFGFIDIVLIVAVIAFGILFAGLVRSAFYVEIHKNVYGSEFYEEPNEKSVYCPNCGAQMKLTDSFCANCGAKAVKKENAGQSDCGGDTNETRQAEATEKENGDIQDSDN